MASESLSFRLRALKHYLERAGVPDDLSAVDEAMKVAVRVEQGDLRGRQESLDPGRCAICGGPIDAFEDVYREHRGWAKPRRDGGTHGLRLREETGRFAHVRCVVAGVPSAQEALDA